MEHAETNRLLESVYHSGSQPPRALLDLSDIQSGVTEQQTRSSRYPEVVLGKRRRGHTGGGDAAGCLAIANATRQHYAQYSELVSPRSTICTHADRSVPQEAVKIFAEGRVAHVGFVQDGQPYVIPLGYQFSPDAPRYLYLHGSPASRLMRHLATAAPVCIAVTLLDGLVYSRTALYHSMNYRSAICFGRGRRVMDEALQRSVYEAMVSRYFPGRTAGRDYSEPTAEHLAATMLIEVEIEEWSAKRRAGGPMGPLDAGEDAPGTRGVAPL